MKYDESSLADFSKHDRPQTETPEPLLPCLRWTHTSPELPGCYSVEKHKAQLGLVFSQYFLRSDCGCTVLYRAIFIFITYYITVLI